MTSHEKKVDELLAKGQAPNEAEEVPTPHAQSRDAELEAGRMPFMDHLRDLRVRVRNAILALLVACVITYNFKEEIFALLLRPLVEIWSQLGLGAPRIHFMSLIEPFWVYLSVTLWSAVFVASPLIFYQVWQFIAPGLYKSERRYGIAFALMGSVFFVSGALFCYSVVLPVIYEFMLNYSDANIAKITRGLGDFSTSYELADAVALQPMLSMQEYLSFAKRLLIGFGIIFELPLAIFFMSVAGIVTHRSLIKFGRWFVVVAFVVGAMLTPPDILSQMFLAGPLIALYYFSIAIAWIVTVRRERRALL